MSLMGDDRFMLKSEKKRVRTHRQSAKAQRATIFSYGRRKQRGLKIVPHTKLY